MNAKLEVIKLTNEDVIATSCKSAWGVALYYDYYYTPGGPTYYGYKGYKNGTNETNKNEPGRIFEEDDLTNEPDGYSGEGFYHINSDGSIIEKCDFFDDYINMIGNHNIDLDN